VDTKAKKLIPKSGFVFCLDQVLFYFPAGGKHLIKRALKFLTNNKHALLRPNARRDDVWKEFNGSVDFEWGSR
jgi:hypothetical protein